MYRHGVTLQPLLRRREGRSAPLLAFWNLVGLHRPRFVAHRVRQHPPEPVTLVQQQLFWPLAKPLKWWKANRMPGALKCVEGGAASFGHPSSSRQHPLHVSTSMAAR